MALSGDIDATWSLANGKIEVVFTKDLTQSNVSGSMGINSKIKIDEAKEKEVTFDLGSFSGKTGRFPTDYKPIPVPKVTKTGALNPDKGTVTWTIIADPNTDANTADDFPNLAGYILKDTFNSKELEYVKDSMTIGGVSIADPAKVTGGFTYTFPSGQTDGPKTITYQTKTLADSWYKKDNTVKNSVELTPPKHPDAKSSSEANVAVKETSLAKTSTKVTRDDVTGAVTVDYQVLAVAKKLTGDKYGTIVIKDTFQGDADFAHFDANSVKVDGIAVAPDNMNIVKNTMTITLPEGTENATLTYSVIITDPGSFSGSYTGFDLKNNAELILDGKVTVKGEKSTSIGVGPGDSVIYFNKNGKFDVDGNGDNILHWTIDVNHSEKDLTGEDLTIEDVARGSGSAHSYMKNTLKVMYGDTDVTADGSKVGINYIDGIDGSNPSFTLTLKAVGKSKVTITYDTKVDGFNINDNPIKMAFENDVTLKCNGFKDQTLHKKAEAPAKKMISKEGRFDGEKSVYGGDGYFDWIIDVNEAGIGMHNGVVSEILPAGHQLVGGTLKVNDTEITTTDTGGSFYLVEPDGFKVHLTDGKEKQKITFRTKTTIPGDTKVLSVLNRCSLTSDETKQTLNAETTVPVSYKPAVKKETKYSVGEKVNWEIIINDNGANLTKQKATLTDQLPPGLAYEAGSAKVTDKAGGDAGPLTTTYDEKTKKLQMTLPDNLDLSKEYKVTFTTDVTNYLSGIKNNISFDGGADPIDAASRKVDLTPTVFGVVVGDNISFKIIKVGAENENKGLPGAEFTLYDKDDKAIEKAVSDKDGIIIFEKGLKYENNYKFAETKAPTGYVLDDNRHTISFGADDQSFAGVTIDGVRKVFYHDQNNTLQVETTVINKLNPAQPEPPVPPEEEGTGKISIDKFVHENGLAVNSDETFYIALFADEKHTKRVSAVQELKMDGGYRAETTFDKLKEGIYYLAETDKLGVPVSTDGLRLNGSNYNPEFDVTKVTVARDSVQKVKLINHKTRINEPEDKPDPDKPGGNDPTGPNGNGGDSDEGGNNNQGGSQEQNSSTSEGSRDVATGDNAVLVMWLLVLLTSIVAGTTLTIDKRR